MLLLIQIAPLLLLVVLLAWPGAVDRLQQGRADLRVEGLGARLVKRDGGPPWRRANAHEKRAVRAPPICRNPVGLGAKRVRHVISEPW